MKKLFSVLAIAIFSLSAMTVSAQGVKLGHINADELLLAMPEMQKVQKDLEAYGASLEKDLKEMMTEYEGKVAQYTQNEAIYTDIARKTKIKEIQDLEGRINEYQSSATKDLQQKEYDLLLPVLEKATNAVQAVAKEMGLTYVFDSSQSKAVIVYAEEGRDLMPAVKKKLGI